MNRPNWFFAALMTACFTGLFLAEYSFAVPVQNTPPAGQAKPNAKPPSEPKQEKPKEPGDVELEALTEKYNAARDKIVKEKVESAELKDRMNVWLSNNPLNTMSKDFFALNEKFPKTQAALGAIALLISQGSGETKDKAIEILIEQFASDERIVKNMSSITTGLPSTKTEKWLKQLVAKSTNKRVQATAIQAHIDYIRSVKQVRDFAERRPDFKAQAGEAVIEYLKEYDFEQAEKDRYVLLTRLSKEFSDTPSGIVNKTFGDRANRELYILDKLTVGKMAMDIEGEDLDGKPIKLSDFRDKVVLMIFWGDWAPPAKRMYAHLRSIEKKLKGKPFEIVGFNSDEEKDFAQAVVKYQKFGWRNFWLNGKQGPITANWKVNSWPTTYILDGKGMIRYKQVQKEDLDSGITKLMAEMGHQVDLSDHSDGDVKLEGPVPKPKNPPKGQLQMKNAGQRPGQRNPGRANRRTVRPQPPRGPRPPRFPGPVINGVLPDLDNDGKPGIGKSK